MSIKELKIDRHGHVPSRITLIAWVKQLEETGSVLDSKHASRQLC